MFAVAHPLVEQLRFARAEWRRGLRGVPEADGFRRFEPMNSIGWIVGHMAWHEQRYWLTRFAGETPRPIVNEVAANGGPATTPSLRQMLEAWKTITAAADPHLTPSTRRRWTPTCRAPRRARSGPRCREDLPLLVPHRRGPRSGSCSTTLAGRSS
jgi:hypothetical protein